jgi:GNAT superfamily N-acetyltransferase
MAYRIRQAVETDAVLIARQRRLMFADSGQYSTSALDELEQRYGAWVAGKLAAGEYRGWLGEDASGQVVAGVGLWLREWPPILNDQTGHQGYVENVYTLPEHRRRGVSRQLMTAMLDWIRESGQVYNVTMHATAAGRPLYESLGFQPDGIAMYQWFGPKRIKP